MPSGLQALLRRLVLILAAVVCLTFLAPWGTYRLGVGQRALQFLLCSLSWEVSVAVVGRLLRWRYGDACFSKSAWPMLLVLMLSSFPASVGMMAAIGVVSGRGLPFLDLYLQSLPLGLVIAFARRGVTTGWMSAPVPAEATPVPEAGPVALGPSTFLLRHAPDLAGNRLLALQAEDHYLRVHTDRGVTLVLMRLRDAIAALGDTTGWQPHRSFWVATDAATRAERRGQGWQLVLENGLVVPVSRNAVPSMRASGLVGQPFANASVTGSTAE